VFMLSPIQLLHKAKVVTLCCSYIRIAIPMVHAVN